MRMLHDLGRTRRLRALRTALVLAGAGLLAACGSGVELPSLGGGSDTGGSRTSGVMSSITTSGKGPIEVDREAFAKQPHCPRLELRQDTFLIMKYERGKEDDPRHMLYQANLENWARECRREGEQTRVKVGLSGRVTPGPAWPGGEIVLPVRIAVLGASPDAPLVSEVFSVPVTVGAGSPAELWSLVEDSFLLPPDSGLKIVFGFDEGPQKKRR
ncbi:hypothetical protein [Polymorphum gilvum]|uniref:Lipoprotein, putative n=1 Tax=Polymorphum gilvum (strain LMG 25793 / CGMCC 1.9160 / SL003B-26A1) TaxID=991905 RepID=F2IZ79_POLGS|nr:hypothetical protein [Polymorphum gilvum]ADZ71802.1 Lipoprotein, putative [Polymorphum gilvum SL003B-26A1]